MKMTEEERTINALSSRLTSALLRKKRYTEALWAIANAEGDEISQLLARDYLKAYNREEPPHMGVDYNYKCLS